MFRFLYLLGFHCLKPFVFCLTVALFYHTFYVHLLFIISVELSHSSHVTVTQGVCNVSPSFRNGLHFAVSFEPLTTHSRYYVLWNTFFDYRLFILLVKISRSSGVTVTHSFCNVFPLPPSGLSTLILSFESFLTHFHNYVV